MNSRRLALIGWIVALMVFLTSCANTVKRGVEHSSSQPIAPSAAPSDNRSGEARPPTAQEQTAITRLMRMAERVRGLRFREQVPVSIENAQAVMSYARAELRADELEHARAIYVALGMLPANMDVEKLLVSLLGEQVVGYYDARKGRLVVRDDVIVGLGSHDHNAQALAAREVLLHELVHALQDQHLGLGERLDEERTSDAENAFRALVEGDAMLAVAGFAARQAGVPLSALIGDRERMQSLAIAITEAATASPLLSEAPIIVREPLLSAYRDGLVYTAHAFLQGNGFAAVDELYASPPTAMRQILHPERPRSDEPAPVLAARDVLASANFTLVADDTLGELELSAYLSASLSPSEALLASDGWDGDVVKVYQDPQGHSLALWLLRGERAQDAEEILHAVERLLLSRCGGACDDQFVARRGRHVLVGHGLPQELFQHVADVALVERLDQVESAH